LDYDPAGNLVALTPPARPPHRFDYTPVDLPETYAPPDLGFPPATRSSYDRERRPVRVERPDGRSVALAYDDADRLASLTVPEGAYRYAYDAAGRLARIDGPAGAALTFGYDGALPTERALIATRAGVPAGRVGYAYDRDFRLAAVRVNGANPIAYGYDPDGLPTKAGALTLTRDPDRGLVAATALGAVTDTRTANPFGEPATYSAAWNGTPLLAFAYTRDALGRLLAQTETIAGETRETTYGYDPAGRLSEVRRTGEPTRTWAYDPNGNRTHEDGQEIAHYDDQDRLIERRGTVYRWSANGELQSKTAPGGATARYSYDTLGNLTRVELANGRAIEYLADPQGRRIAKRTDGTAATGFLWQDDLKPAAELDGAGKLLSRFVYATGINVPDYLVKGGRTYRILTDHLGSPRLVVDTQTGAIAQRLDYDAWGRVTLDTNPGFQPFGFAGGLYDPDTGLVRFGARDYDAELGRWTAKDPIGFGGGDTNLYGYVIADPVNWVDANGLWPDFIDNARKRRRQTTYDAHAEQHPLEHRDIFDPLARTSKKGMNRLDRKKIDDLSRNANIPQDQRRALGDYIEKIKRGEGRGGDDNYSWQDLLDIAEEFKRNYCP
jgi:RHS repeat-associated protein